VGVAHLPVPALSKEISLFPLIKVEHETECNGVEIILLAKKFLNSSLLYWYTLRDTAMLFMSMARKDITVSNYGGATC